MMKINSSATRAAICPYYTSIPYGAGFVVLNRGIWAKSAGPARRTNHLQPHTEAAVTAEMSWAIATRQR
jgi:hypothetical protein